MKKDPKVFLKHILESIVSIEEYMGDLTEEDFLEDQQLQDAIVRRLEIIGEASNYIPKEFQLKHPEVPWSKIIGMRNTLIHGYFGIDLILVWNTAQQNLPELKVSIQKLLKEQK